MGERPFKGRVKAPHLYPGALAPAPGDVLLRPSTYSVDSASGQLAINQLHVTEVTAQSKHDCLSLESMIAFQGVSHFISAHAPIILESRVEESEINEEIQNALVASRPGT